jgi:hypothetical protein
LKKEVSHITYLNRSKGQLLMRDTVSHALEPLSNPARQGKWFAKFFIT